MNANMKRAEVALTLINARNRLKSAETELSHARALLEELAEECGGAVEAAALSSESGSLWAFWRIVDTAALNVGRMAKRVAPRKRAPRP